MEFLRTYVQSYFMPEALDIQGNRLVRAGDIRTCGSAANAEVPYTLKQMEHAFRNVYPERRIPSLSNRKEISARHWYCKELGNDLKYRKYLVANYTPIEAPELVKLTHPLCRRSRNGCEFNSETFPIKLEQLEQLWVKSGGSPLTYKEWEQFKKNRKSVSKTSWYCWHLSRGKTEEEKKFCFKVAQILMKANYKQKMTEARWRYLFTLSPDDFQKEIAQIYAPFMQTIPAMLENDCKKMGDIRTFLKHQNFFRHYFTPRNPKKGMLVWHDVGVGKTCLAVADLSFTFERENWNVLWVTRRTLADAPLNAMFRGTCYKGVRDAVRDKKLSVADLKNPNNQNKLFDEYVRRNWSGATTLGKRESRYASQSDRIMTYVQFSNFVSPRGASKSRIRNLRVDPSWEKDRLRKTVIVIDEAHNLYNKLDLPSIERPKTDVIEQAIWHSYATSGKDSCRVILLTATPILEGGEVTSLTKLLNLTMPATKVGNKYVGNLPTTTEGIKRRYFSQGFDTGTDRYRRDTEGVITFFAGSRQPNLFATKWLGNVIKTEVTPQQMEKIRQALGVKKLKVAKAKKSPKSNSKALVGCTKHKKPSCGTTSISSHCMWVPKKGCRIDPKKKAALTSEVKKKAEEEKMKAKEQKDIQARGPLYPKMPVAKTAKQAMLVRKYANFGELPRKMIIDSASFTSNEKANWDYLKKNWRKHTGKYSALMDGIAQVDAQDKANTKQLFKHVVYTDLGKGYGGYGVKILSAIFMAEEYKNGKFSSEGRGLKKTFSVVLPSPKTAGKKTFLPLSSTSIKGKYFFTNPREPYPDTAEGKSALSAAAMDTFNKRPENVYGDNIRFLLIDSGFKEGVSLYDARHFWLLEVPLSKSALTQAIGRVVRLCGQSSLPFHGKDGWVVYIHVLFSVAVVEDHGKPIEQQVYTMEVTGNQQESAQMKTDLIKMSVAASVDKLLNEAIHTYRRPGWTDPEVTIANEFNIA